MDQNNAQGDGAVHQILCQLPSFWKDNPDYWFRNAERYFHISNITAPTTKYHYVVRSLDQAAVRELTDILDDDALRTNYEFKKKEGRSTIQAVQLLVDEINFVVYKKKTPLYALFLDVKKAFDTVSRHFIFEELVGTGRFSVRELNLLAEMLDANFLTVRDGVSVSEPIVQSNGQEKDVIKGYLSQWILKPRESIAQRRAHLTRKGWLEARTVAAPWLRGRAPLAIHPKKAVTAFWAPSHSPLPALKSAYVPSSFSVASLTEAGFGSKVGKGNNVANPERKLGSDAPISVQAATAAPWACLPSAVEAPGADDNSLEAEVALVTFWAPPCHSRPRRPSSATSFGFPGSNTNNFAYLYALEWPPARSWGRPAPLPRQERRAQPTDHSERQSLWGPYGRPPPLFWHHPDGSAPHVALSEGR
ncbi:Hypothetical predicted protein [Cloeon dipterum]|uniref:DUF7041 domain-containing protein n=1 Tax=Cloeon dipterum TaxID=197152 RepID=A0A8S1E5P2_9INSE|nr:Hypothetical predicted protein [Cloeon dipterum]